jgi:hypothetical protein
MVNAHLYFTNKTESQTAVAELTKPKLSRMNPSCQQYATKNAETNAPNIAKKYIIVCPPLLVRSFI